MKPSNMTLEVFFINHIKSLTILEVLDEIDYMINKKADELDKLHIAVEEKIDSFLLP